MYNSKSSHATEFIGHDEILNTIEYAEKNRKNAALLNQILEKGAECKGLTYSEAATLLLCDDEAVQNRMFEIAMEIKRKIYGKRIVMFAPLYLSNYCVNGCRYCPYHHANCHICLLYTSRCV